MREVLIEKRFKFAPAVIQKDENSFSVRVLNKDVKVKTSRPEICEKVTTEYRIDYKGTSPKKYVSMFTISAIPVPSWYKESQTSRKYREKFYFEGNANSQKYSEKMTTQSINAPKTYVTEVFVQTEEYNFQNSFELENEHKEIMVELPDCCQHQTQSVFQSPRMKSRKCLFEELHAQVVCSP